MQGISRRAAQLAGLGLGLGACLLAGCGDQTLVAGLFLNTPAVTVVNPLDGSTQTFGPYAAMLGYVLTVDTSDIANLSAADITPVSGVEASVSFESCIGAADPSTCVSTGHGGTDRILTVPPEEAADAGTADADGGTDPMAGLYELLSINDANLTFEQGVTYTLILQVPDGDTFDAYGARFKPGPPAHMVEFADKTKPIVRQAADTTPLVVTRDDPKVNGELLPAAVLVGLIDPNNPTAVPSIVYKSFDYTDPATLALYTLSDEPYRVPSFTIDASVFAAGGYYVVTMVSLSAGTASANAFIGSTALAGSGDSGLVVVE